MHAVVLVNITRSFKTVETMAEPYSYHAIVGTNFKDGAIRKWRKINLTKASLSVCSF